jgi:site-specific recombinase XerD
VRVPAYRAALGVMYGCGLRISEAVALGVKDIDGARRVIRVVGKGNKERLTPVPSPLLEDLRAVWREHRHPQWVFVNKEKSGPLEAAVLTKVFGKVRNELDLDVFITYHTLRHSYATRLVEKGIPIETVAIVMGHASIKTTQTYLHLTQPLQEQIRTAVNGFSVPLFAQEGGVS